VSQIASQVQILSGERQYARVQDGQMLGSDRRVFERVTIGMGCRIGAAATVVADVGDGRRPEPDLNPGADQVVNPCWRKLIKEWPGDIYLSTRLAGYERKRAPGR
jgi:hypothetical protein